MKTAEEIKKIINDNRSKIAFIIGNGIHRHPDNKGLSWEQLLLDLWNLVSNSRDTKLKKGISHTEMYDVIELTIKERIRKLKDGSFHKELRESNTILSEESRQNLNRLREDFTNKFPDKTLFDILEQINTASEYLNTDKHLTIKKTPEELNQIIKNIERLGKHQHPYKVLDHKDCENIHNNSIASAIAEKMTNWSAEDHHKIIVSQIKNLSAPVLTTNYDKVLANAVDAKLKKMPNYSFTDYYPWSSYYSYKDLMHTLDDFGVWHINGMVKYHRSIRLGLCQYMGSVTQARKLIHKNKEELFTGKNQEHWGGRNTWLHIIFNKSLFIFGLALEENETFLRWLLLQRANYFNKFPDRKYEGWYLTRKEDIDKSPGKRFFLENVGIEILEVEDYKTIYEDIWQ